MVEFGLQASLYTLRRSVPSMVADLTESSLAGHPLEGLLFGGSPTPDSLVGRAKKAFPKAVMCAFYRLNSCHSFG